MQKYTINLLLIEDNKDDFIAIDDILSKVESSNISLDWKNTYEEGLAAIETGEYDVCLLDSRLGEKDGIELLKTAIELNCQTPIIFITGQDDRELDLLAMKIGAADYLNKLEIREYTLERVIRYAIERNKNLIALQESQAKLQEAQKIPHLGNWEFNLKTQKITWSDEVFRIFGLSGTQKSLTYAEFLQMFVPESRKLWEENMALILEKTQKCECEYEIIRPDGTLRYLYTKTTLITNSNLESIGIFGTILDITKRQLAELEVKKIRKQEHLLSLVIDRIHQSLNLEEILETTVESVREFLQCDRVLIYRFLPNGHGVVEKESLAPNCLSLLGMTIVDPCFRNSNILERYKQGYFSIIHNINQSGMQQCHIDMLRELQVKANIVLPILITNETKNKNHTDNSEINVWGLLIAHHCRENRQWEISETDLLRRLAAQTAITIQQAQLYQRLEKLNQELEAIAYIDDLTGVFNRRHFEQKFKQEWKRLAREQGLISIIMLDIDYFKPYNDTYGHQQGDKCLQQVAKAIQTTVKRPGDFVARYGGEEFVVVLPNTPMEGALKVAENIRTEIEALKIPHQASATSQWVTSSLGVADTNCSKTSNPERLLKAADTALYNAKTSGRNRIGIYYISMESLEKQQQEINLVTQLRDALRENGFCLFSQAIVPLHEGVQARLYEVLLRFRYPSGKIVSPATFLPVAERYHLMPVIDRWVVKNLLYFMSLHKIDNSHRDCIFTVNLSGASINDSHFLEFIEHQFACFEVPPQKICFEITETIAITNLDKAAKFIQSLKQVGCSFALDDFGKGMSSFSDLTNLPVDYLKINGMFIKKMEKDTVTQAIVEGIHHIGRAMNLKVIAEYIETESILNKVNSLGIDYGQGFYLDKPSALLFSV
ncbi:MAG: EAL domain-containing protein [Okeania sp. SIO2C2]|uniref:GGDEF domain-containing response regulator n=1 Tax=Okeania sp. SIO2C2 TaxID=2607787 RepID=UPI0013BA339E|nr:GGDEF domain-containing response regulator [Okeania sp. SIO2C2]NEP89428.1 EAL domain-containing protein [Okeania sp. SIO2C2]